MRIAKRIETLPPYLFAALDAKLAAKRAEGVDVISLGVGDPDLPTPAHIVRALQDAAADPQTHRYPSYFGAIEFRQAVARLYRRRFSVDLDPETQIMALIGSKEGLAHLSLAFLETGDEALVPDPGYPVYGISARLAGATPISMPMTAEAGFQPDLGSITPTARTKLLWLNYPSNPTAAVADDDLFARSVTFARDHDVLLAHDAAYSEITFDGYVAPSILETAGAMEVALEFGSLSKHYNMTGWRIGWAAGSAEAIRALAVVKTNVDSGQFTAVQRAAIAALDGPQDHLDDLRAVYQKRRDRVVSALNAIGWSIEPPRGSIYVWAPTLGGRSSTEMTDLLLEHGVFVAPGSGYGPGGEGFIRLSLTVPDDRLDVALERIAGAVA